MTADVELLPLPEVKLDGFTTHDMADYARANVAHATAAKDAEIEALEVQIAGLTAQVEHHTAYAITHRGVLRYCTSGMRDAYADEKVRADAAEARAERLEEALRLALKWAEVLPPGEPLRKESEADLSAARAALRDHDQEGNDHE